MSDGLNIAIAMLYETFTRYRVGSLDGCPCCVLPEEIDRLKSAPLREADPETVASFAFCASNTWGTLNELKHFLPRILELKAHGLPWPNLQIIYGKFAQHGPWLPDEMTAIVGFTRALFLHSLSHPHGECIATVIESAGVAKMSVVPLLEEALTVLSPERATQIARVVDREAGPLTRGGQAWVWSTETQRLVHRWLLSAPVRDYLMRAFEDELDHRDAGEWASACDILEALGTPSVT
jgi:hypothetical protein